MRVMLHFGLWNLGLAKAETQTSPAERDCLARHAVQKKMLAEIGVWHGVTTSRLRKAMRSDGVLFAVDPYPVGQLGFSAQRVIARREVSKIPNGAVVWVEKTGAEAARDFAASGTHFFDFVFIDGDHTYEGLKADWCGWSQLIKQSGVVALHDSHPTPGRDSENTGSIRYTSEVIFKDPRFELIDSVDSLTVLRRTKDT